MAFDLTSYMSDTGAETISGFLGISLGMLFIIAVVILLLKGLAMYKAARLKEKWWFWLILIINSFGIIPAIYLIIRRNKKVNY